MKRYLLCRADGVSVQEVNDGFDIADVLKARAELKPDEILTEVREITADVIPSDRTFRDAWRPCAQTGIRHCLEAAKEIHRNTIRKERAAHFLKTDVLLRDAGPLRRDASAVISHVMELRDATNDPAIDAASSVEELKAVRPAVFDKPVPELGEKLAPGEAAPYDTQALENWANGLTDQIARLEAATSGGIQRDLQSILSKVDEIITTQDEKIASMAEQLDFVTNNAVKSAKLTTEEVKQ